MRWVGGEESEPVSSFLRNIRWRKNTWLMDFHSFHLFVNNVRKRKRKRKKEKISRWQFFCSAKINRFMQSIAVGRRKSK